MAQAKLKQLMEKRNAVNARIRREQNKLTADKRKADTRRKVLAGAAVLEWAARDTDFSMRLMSELQSFLKRDADRVIFGFAPVGKSKHAEKDAA
jgi:large subunit ribosomal protein L7/L12